MSERDLNNSRPLDVHRWSAYPEVNSLVNTIWSKYLEPKFSNATASNQKQPNKKQFKVLLLDLFVSWAEDPEQSIGISFTTNNYKAKSRYNALHISAKVIDITKALMDSGLLEHHLGSETAGKTTRIWPSTALIEYFNESNIQLEMVDNNKNQECIVLNGNYPDANPKTKAKPIEYEDKDHPMITSWRNTIESYNEVLRETYIDIYDLDFPWIKRTKINDKGIDQTNLVQIGQHKKFVRRVFYRGSWELGGRLHGGFWQGIGSDNRSRILINDEPTVEVDFSGMHVSIVCALNDIQPPKDPYRLKEVHLENFTSDEQRKVVKSLLLMCFNAKTVKGAYQAFRRKQTTGTKEKKLKNKQLELLLNKFIEENPAVEEYIGSDKGVILMKYDSDIAYEIIKRFTARDKPILCVHDSFIVEHTEDDYLRHLMDEITTQVIGKKINLNSKALGFGALNAMKNLDPMDRDTYLRNMEYLREQHEKIKRSHGYSLRYARWKQWNTDNNN